MIAEVTLTVGHTPEEKMKDISITFKFRNVTGLVIELRNSERSEWRLLRGQSTSRDTQ